MTIDKINPIAYSYSINDINPYPKINRSKPETIQQQNPQGNNIRFSNVDSNYSNNYEIFYIHNPVLRGSKSFKAALKEAIREVLKEELEKKNGSTSTKESVDFKSDFEKISNLPNGKYINISFQNENLSIALSEPENSIKNLFSIESKLNVGKLVNLIV